MKTVHKLDCKRSNEKNAKLRNNNEHKSIFFGNKSHLIEYFILNIITKVHEKVTNQVGRILGFVQVVKRKRRKII